MPILIIAIIAVAIFVYVLFPRNDGISDYDPCKNWIAAMEKQDMEGAIRAANLIVGDKKIISRNSPIFEHCINISREIGINKYFYETRSFNILDFQLWNNAFRLKKIADEIDEIEFERKAKAIYDLVLNNVRNGENGNIDWPLTIWERGSGSCDRQAWVCLSLAKQLGLDAVLLLYRNPETGESPHTTCLIIGDDGECCLLDTFTKTFAPCCISEITNDNSGLSARLYSSNEHYKRSMAFCDFVYCEDPQNFCMKNRDLQTELIASLGNSVVPVFGGNQDVIFKRIEKAIRISNDDKICPIAFWDYPFSLIGIQLKKQAE